MDVTELIEAITLLEKERGLTKEVMLTAIEEALNTAYGYKKDKNDEGFDPNADPDLGKRIEVDRETGNVTLVIHRKVVEKVENPDTEISLEDILKDDPDFTIGEVAEYRFAPEELGRIASHNAKQNIIQKLKEAERNMILSTYHSKLFTIVPGVIQKIEKKTNAEGVEESIIHLDLEKVEGILAGKEQVTNEKYRQGDKMKFLIVDIKEKPGKGKDPVVLVSRSHPGLVKKLFETEVPEIGDGIVEIKSVAREAGSRTKIAVFSNDPEVEPVGSCVGTKGSRVESIVQELKGERIDIIKWSPSPAEFITSSLSPAKVYRTYINDEDKTSTVIVPDDQLSLAIGKEGQNVRLAAKLTGWKIDIKSESQIKASIEADLYEEGLTDTVYEGNTDENSSFSTVDSE